MAQNTAPYEATAREVIAEWDDGVLVFGEKEPLETDE